MSTVLHPGLQDYLTRARAPPYHVREGTMADQEPPNADVAVQTPGGTKTHVTISLPYLLAGVAGVVVLNVSAISGMYKLFVSERFDRIETQLACVSAYTKALVDVHDREYLEPASRMDTTAYKRRMKVAGEACPKDFMAYKVTTKGLLIPLGHGHLDDLLKTYATDQITVDSQLTPRVVFEESALDAAEAAGVPAERRTTITSLVMKAFDDRKADEELLVIYESKTANASGTP